MIFPDLFLLEISDPISMLSYRLFSTNVLITW